jgi:hypothetical protein
MLLKTVRVLSEIGALDLAAVTGTSVPVSETTMVSIQQAFGLPGGGSQPSLGDGSASNLVKDLFAAHEHIITHLRDKAAHQIEPDLDSIGKTHPLSLSVYINRKKVIADDQSPGTGPAGPKAAVL